MKIGTAESPRMIHHLTSAALAIALLACFAFPLVFPVIAVDDTPSYLNPAREWAAGRGLREANGEPLQNRLPLYPLMLGCVIRIAGESPLGFGILNVALHATSILLVRSALPKRPRSDLLCALALVYPPLLTSSGLVLEESLIAFTLAALFAASTRALSPRAHAGWAFLAGIALGASALAKSTVLPAGALLFVLIWRAADSRRHALVYASAATLLIGPWMIHNRLELGRFEMVNGNAGVALFAGTVANVVSPSWGSFPEYLGARARWEEEGRAREPVFDRYLARLAIGRIAADPRRWAALALERGFRFMLPARHWFVVTGRSEIASAGPAYLAATAVQMLLFAACALLFLRGIRRSRDAAALVAPLIVFSHQLVYAASHASPRYGATVGPLIFAALGLLALPLPRSPRPWHVAEQGCGDAAGLNSAPGNARTSMVDWAKDAEGPWSPLPVAPGGRSRCGRSWARHP